MPDKYLIADRIHGATLQPGHDPRTSTCHIQYTDAQGRLVDLSMPFLDAMYLLNLLRSMQLTVGFEMPEDPRQD